MATECYEGEWQRRVRQVSSELLKGEGIGDLLAGRKVRKNPDVKEGAPSQGIVPAKSGPPCSAVTDYDHMAMGKECLATVRHTRLPE